MTKAGELDWSELYKSGKSLEPEHPLSRPLSKGKIGSEVVHEFGEGLSSEIVEGFKTDGIRQPTDKEMFGNLVKTKEEIEAIKKAEEKGFDETLHAYNDWKPAQVVKKHNFDQESWGTGRPLLDNEQLEELRKANKQEIEGV